MHLRPSVFASVAITLAACGRPAIDPGQDEGADEVGTETDSGSTDTESTDGESTESTESTDSETTESTDEDSESTDTGPPPCPEVHDGNFTLSGDVSEAQLEAASCLVEITGDLHIQGTELTELDAFASLERVGQRLTIINNTGLTTLSGLDALEEVRDRVQVSGNAGLESLAGLGGLRRLHGLTVSNNPDLLSLEGVQGEWELHAWGGGIQSTIFIAGNDALTSVDGLGGITSVSSELPVRVVLLNNEVLGGDLSGLSAFAALPDDTLGISLQNSPIDSVEGLEALVHARYLWILGLAGDYLDLSGLDNLERVSAELTIGYCQGPTEVDPDGYDPQNLAHIQSLAGLEQLTEVANLDIWGNLALTDISALANLETVGDLDIEANPLLPQAQVDAIVAGIPNLGSANTDLNGTGNEPSCGFIPW